MIDGEWLYELSGSSVDVIGGSLTVLFFSRVSRPQWPQLGGTLLVVTFYALYPVVSQQLGMVVYNMTIQNRVRVRRIRKRFSPPS